LIEFPKELKTTFIAYYEYSFDAAAV